MEEMHRAGHGERLGSFHTLSEQTTFPASVCVHQPGSSPNLIPLSFFLKIEV